MSGPRRPPATLLGLSWPLMISFTTRSLLTSIDIPYAATLGDEAVAAIGLAFPLEFAFIACWIGVSSALTSHLSRAFGEGDEARVEQLLRTTRDFVVVLSAFFLGLAGVVYAFAPRLGVDPAVAENFRWYAPIIVVGAALVGFWSAIPDSVVKAHHDTRSTMVAGLITAFSNVALNTLFVFGFGWGIVGIAVATGFARAGALAYALRRAARLEAERRRTAPAATGKLLERPHRTLLVLGVPTALTFVLIGTENLAVNAFLARLDAGTASLAAYAIYHRASFLFLMPVVGIGVAIVPFVGRAVGAGRVDDVRSGLRDAFRFAVLYALLFVAPVCWLAAGPIAGWLGDAPATEALATFAIRWAVPLAVLAASPFMLCRPVFEGVQRGVPGLVMGALRYLLLSVPLAYAGSRLAPTLGRAPFEGVLLGLVGGSALVSIAFLAWLSRLLSAAQWPQPK